MKGRIEQKISSDKRLESAMSGQPQVIKDYSNDFRDKTFNTREGYVKIAIKLSDFLIKEYGINIGNVTEIRNINFTHVNNYIEHISKKADGSDASVSHISREYYAIKDFFEFLETYQYIDMNPCNKVKIPKDNSYHPVVYLTEDEIKEIECSIINGDSKNNRRSDYNKFMTRDLCIFYIGITTGLRVSAIRNINIEDIDLKENTLITIEKGGVGRKIFLPSKVVGFLRTYLKDRSKYTKIVNEDALFISARGSRVSVDTIGRILKSNSKGIDKHITPHKMRSTAASNLYAKTGDIYLAAEVLGHKNIQNTKRYTNISETSRKNAAEILGGLI